DTGIGRAILSTMDWSMFRVWNSSCSHALLSSSRTRSPYSRTELSARTSHERGSSSVTSVPLMRSRSMLLGPTNPVGPELPFHITTLVMSREVLRGTMSTRNPTYLSPWYDL